jgi:hypothetical protein
MGLFAMLKLFQLKEINRWSDCSFKDLFTLLKDMLPPRQCSPWDRLWGKINNLLVGFGGEKIHACKNDCILYRGHEYDDLEKCPICGLGWFNQRKEGSDDENYNRNRRKGRPKKCFGTFLSFLVWSIGLQSRSQNYCDGTKRSMSRMLEW